MTEYGIKAAKALLAMQRLPWEQGYAAQAFYEAGADDIWLPMARESAFRAHPDGRLALLADSMGVCDPASNGEVCLRAWEKTGDEFFLKAFGGMRDYLMQKAPRSSGGYIHHTMRNPQLWIDAAYMMPPFLYAAGLKDEAYHQTEGYIKYLRDERTGLFRHIYDFENASNNDDRLWATGNGWILMGLERMNHPLTDDLLKTMLEYLTEDGLFHDVMDDEASFTDGTSALMTAGVIYRRILEGRLERKSEKTADRIYETCLGKMDSLGILHGVCGAPRFSGEGTSAEAQASFVLADAYRQRLKHSNL